ncbi:hypothetical protein GCM10009592_18820 [Brachybacterium rhamnosum]|uniref:Uncharacterized protein n=1 Tax=Brachybacterium rhamnosum TaxID=173361 RepID=A0ABW4PXA1_9MICO|nr:hypothetical protein [Brachybacterium sp. SGAir0954]QCR53438.1 hypothetical protein C1N80_07485 [Brachybacterium sp. SGAir0954]
MQLRLARKHWAIVAATAALAVGGCAMAWSWGIWGVFVACAALTSVGSTAPALLLLPRSAVTPMLVAQVASCAVWFMLIGWGLVLLLDPAYTVGWVFPGKSGVGARVVDEDDAWRIGWLILGLGLFCTVTVIAVEIIPRLRRARRES